MGLPRFNEDSYAHFVTTKTYRGQRIFDDAKCYRIVTEDIKYYSRQFDFEVVAYCVMPDHLHLIVWWDVDRYPRLTISTIMHRIKGRSAKRISDYLLAGRRGFHAPPKNSRGIKASATQEKNTRDTIPIWQPSFYDFNIYSEKMLRQKVEYIHWNPVRAGLCSRPEDWRWSSLQVSL